MADLENRNVNTKFSGLTTTVALFGVVGMIALVGFESFRQMRRLPKTYFVPFWKHDKLEQQGGRGGIDRTGDDRGGNAVGTREKLTCEDWEMGHLYLARQFHATTPSPLMARWPFAWAWQALKLDDWFFATHTGMDTVVYVRFLRACMWYMLLHSLTTAPILLAIHFYYAVETHKDQADFSLNDMSQASLSYLVTTTICLCANGTTQSTPCGDKANSTSADRKTYLSDYEGCEHRPNEDGRKLLWVHLLLAWYVSFSWFYALWWIGKGSLRIRRRWVEEIRVKRQQAYEENQQRQAMNAGAEESAQDGEGIATSDPYVPTDLKPRAVIEEKHGMSNLVRGDDNDGWRQRTLLITNLPPTMRDEASIRRYFEEFLRPDDGESEAGTEQDHIEARESERDKSEDSTPPQNQEHEGSPPSPVNDPTSAVTAVPSTLDVKHATFSADAKPEGPEPDVHPERHLRSPVQNVVLVRKMNELSSMLSRRQDVLARLEAAHIKLAQTVMAKVGSNSKAMRQSNAEAPGGVGGLGGLGKRSFRNSRLLRRLKQSALSSEASADVEKTAALKRSEEKQRLDELTRRLARFSPDNQGIHVREAQTRTESELGGREMTETVWEALSQVPRDLLDPYQPVTRLSSLFRGQKVPTIDYLLTKLNLLTALVTEMRARPPTSYEPTSTAFVTFRDPRQARMVWRELKTQIVVKVRLAPEVKDLDWERLMRTSFTGDIVRGLGVNTFFWIFTILWVIPVTLLTTSLFSVDKLIAIFPVLNNFFADNPRFEGFVSVTLPTIIVSLLTLAVPELIFQISKRAQGFVTFSALYDQCLCRYWKFIICNVVIFFCVGATTVQSVIFQLGTNNNVLSAVAFSFPTAAPFYISYLILGMGVHTGFELFGFMVPLIQHMGARNASTPRSRALKTLPRNFNRYYWLPLHILIMSIAFMFAILNPLILPFALVYLWVALAVFKKNFAYQYFRRFNEKEGVIYFIRLLRFSLDGLLLAQIVMLVFFSVTRQEGAYIGLMAVLIPFNVGVKLMGTRLWKSQCRAVEDEEANALCGIGSSQPLSPSLQRDYMGQSSTYGQREFNGSFAFPLDARASGRYPATSVSPPTSSRLVSWWNKVHDSFHANGNDRPSVLSVNHGNRVGVKLVTQAVASAPVAVAKKTAKRSRNIAQATSVATSMPANGFSLHKTLAISSAFPEGEEEMSPTEKQTAGPIASASAHDVKKMLEHGDAQEETIRRLGRKRSEHGSHRHHRATSGESPFLSGFDALVNHAPVDGSEDGSNFSYGDGEYEEMLSLRRREAANYLRRRQSKGRRSASQGNHPRSSSLSIIRASEATDASFSAADMNQQRENDPLNQVKDDSRTAVRSAYADRQEDDDLDEDAIDYDDSLDGGLLVKPHAKVRWDDTPNNHARYNNPFYSVELDPFLWLPRDPLAPVDLCDTIEWHGAALVSSQGGQGRVGEWDEDEEGSDVSEGTEKNMSVLLQEEEDHAAGILRFNGDEKIEITGALAQRIQEAEDSEEVADPAASIPRNQLDDFKRALDEDMEVIAEEERDESLSGPRSPLSLTRVRSPRRTASMGRRSASMSNEPFTLEEERTPLTGTPRDELDAAHGRLTLPSSGPPSPEARRTMSRRRPSVAASSVRSSSVNAEGVAGGGGGGHGTRSQHVSMQRALKAEVLEEEYLLSIKERVAKRGNRRSENASTLSTTQEESGDTGEFGEQGVERSRSFLFPRRHSRRSVFGSPTRTTRRPSQASTGGVSSPIDRSTSQRTDLNTSAAAPFTPTTNVLVAEPSPMVDDSKHKAGDYPLQDLTTAKEAQESSTSKKTT